MNSQPLGRRYERIYPEVLLPDLNEIENAKLASMEREIREMLKSAGCEEIIYDAEAAAYSKRGERTPPRTEPVMLHRWKGSSGHKEIPCIIDREGLKIIIRGCGDIQDALRERLKIREFYPERFSAKKKEIYTFEYKQI